jgi:hypothetical protein
LTVADVLLFDGLVVFADGSSLILDMDVPGWRSALGKGVVTVSLVPKQGVVASDGTSFQPVTVQIPDGAMPELKTRVKQSLAASGDAVLAGLRIYGIGYARGEESVMVWVLPDGSIDVGADSVLADLMLDRLTATALGAA